MTDDQDERFRQHEEILRSLTAMLVKQDSINERLTLAIERIDRSIERIDQTLAHVEITQARIETLLARLLRTESNGRDA
jgi:hypothetical protein